MVRDPARGPRRRLSPVDGRPSTPAPPLETASGRGPAPSTDAGRLADRGAFAWGVIVAAAVLVGLVVLLAAVRRGLDLTDESDYIQSEMHAGAYLRSS